MSGAFLRRRDRAHRPLRLEHYRTAVNNAVTTRVFPGLEDDHLALSLAGKRNRLTSNDFVRAGVTTGLSAESARDIVMSLCGRLSAHLDDLDPASDRVDRAIEVWKRRIETTAD